MTIRGLVAGVLVGALSTCLGVLPVHAAPTLINAFNPSQTGGLVSIAFDGVSGDVFVYDDFTDVIHRFTAAGAFVGTIPQAGAGSNDFDLDISTRAINIAGTVVPTNTLLLVNGDETPDTLRGVDKGTGALLATRTLPTSSPVGGSYHDARDTLFAVNFSADTIQEINTNTGVSLNTFPVRPLGSPVFDVFFGDVDVNQLTGNLFIVSDSQNTIRELTATGAFVQDLAVGGLGVSGMSGIALDEATGEAWISSTNGTIFRLGDIFEPAQPPPPGVPAPPAVLLLGLGAVAIAWRKRRA